MTLISEHYDGRTYWSWLRFCSLTLSGWATESPGEAPKSRCSRMSMLGENGGRSARRAVPQSHLGLRAPNLLLLLLAGAGNITVWCPRLDTFWALNGPASFAVFIQCGDLATELVHAAAQEIVCWPKKSDGVSSQRATEHRSFLWQNDESRAKDVSWEMITAFQLGSDSSTLVLIEPSTLGTDPNSSTARLEHLTINFQPPEEETICLKDYKVIGCSIYFVSPYSRKTTLSRNFRCAR